MRIPSWLPGVVFLGIMGSAGLIACDSQGPAEEAGESIDETAEETSETMDEAQDDAEETYEDMTEDE